MYKVFASPLPRPLFPKKLTLALQNWMSEFQVHSCLKTLD
jgi:hypothetical protein